MLILGLTTLVACSRAQDDEEKFSGDTGKNGQSTQDQIPDAAKDSGKAGSKNNTEGQDPFGDNTPNGSQGDDNTGGSISNDLTEEEMDLGRVFVNGWDGLNDEIPSGSKWKVVSVAVLAVDDHGVVAGQVDQNTGDIVNPNTRDNNTTPGNTPGTTPNNNTAGNNPGGTTPGGSTGTVPNVQETADAVIFTIPKGTGRNAWNTEATTVTAKVGKKFILVNGDDVPHQWHTNGAPCQHGQLLQPGQRQECNPRPYNGPPLYDHNTRGQFFIKAQ
mgnify:FL=1